MLPIRYLQPEAILGLHDALSDRPTGQVNIEGIREIVQEVVKVDEYGADAYPEIFTKASAYLTCTVKIRPFVENNGLIAWVCAVCFLALNGVRVSATIEDRHELIRRIEGGQAGEDEIVDFLYQHSEFADPPRERRSLWE